MSMRWKSLLKVAAVILIGGLIRFPLEQGYTAQMQEAGHLEKPLELSLRDDLGQSAFLATLGGFRGPVATLFAIEAVGAWQECNWGVVDSRYALCNKLQPKEVAYWTERAWMAGINAPHNYKYRLHLTPQVLQMRLCQQEARAISILREGIQHCPDSYTLYDTLGEMLSDSRKALTRDFAGAYEAFTRGSKCPGAPRFMARKADYVLARIPGREAEAWRVAMAGYRRDKLIRYAMLLATLEPVVKTIDPSAILPLELVPHAAQLRQKEAAMRRTDAEPAPVVTSPMLPQSPK